MTNPPYTRFDNSSADTGEPPSRPTAIRRMIRSAHTSVPSATPTEDDAPASRRDLHEAIAQVLKHRG